MGKTKIKFEIHQLQREMERNYLELGKLTYSHTKEDHMATFSGNTEFFRIVERVDDVKKEIAAKIIKAEKLNPSIAPPKYCLTISLQI